MKTAADMTDTAEITGFGGRTCLTIWNITQIL